MPSPAVVLGGAQLSLPPVETGVWASMRRCGQGLVLVALQLSLQAFDTLAFYDNGSEDSAFRGQNRLQWNRLSRQAGFLYVW